MGVIGPLVQAQTLRGPLGTTLQLPAFPPRSSARGAMCRALVSPGPPPACASRGSCSFPEPWLLFCKMGGDAYSNGTPLPALQTGTFQSGVSEPWPPYQLDVTHLPLFAPFFFRFYIFDTAGPFCSSSTTWPITQGGPTGPGLPLLCARASPPRAKAASNGGCADRERLNTKGWVGRDVGPGGGWDREGGDHF